MSKPTLWLLPKKRPAKHKNWPLSNDVAALVRARAKALNLSIPGLRDQVNKFVASNPSICTYHRWLIAGYEPSGELVLGALKWLEKAKPEKPVQ